MIDYSCLDDRVTLDLVYLAVGTLKVGDYVVGRKRLNLGRALKTLVCLDGTSSVTAYAEEALHTCSVKLGSGRDYGGIQ